LYAAIAFMLAIVAIGAVLAIKISPLAPAGLVPLLVAAAKVLPTVMKGSTPPAEATADVD
jgi:hypothetical protein